MERFEIREGQIGDLGNCTFGIVEARGGRLIGVARTEIWETREDVAACVKRMRAKRDAQLIDVDSEQADNAGASQQAS
jgi:hypothetical protein